MYNYDKDDPLNFLALEAEPELSTEEYFKLKEEGCLLRESGNCQGPIDIDHITTRGAGGKNTFSNLMVLCRLHHIEKGQIGYSKMIRKYEAYKTFLEVNGREDIFLKAERTRIPEVKEEDIPF